MSMKDDVTAVRNLLSDPKHWTQRAPARTAEGNCVSTISPDAVCWCLAAAVNKTFPFDTPRNVALFNFLLLRTPDHSIVDFNDDATHDQVLAFLDAAIEAAP